MEEEVLSWLRAQEGEVFASPRTEKFNRRAKDFEITKLRDDRVIIRFVGSKYPALPLTFSMFDRTIKCLREHEGKPVRLGAKVAPPYENDTIEGAIWKSPYPIGNTPYKVSPHVCDILALAGVVEYASTINQSTGRKVQAVKLSRQCPATQKKHGDFGHRGIDKNTLKKEESVSMPPAMNMKDIFLQQYKESIVSWTMENLAALVSGRKNYSWNNKPSVECIKERNQISRTLVSSRKVNNGGVDVETLDKVTSWGGFGSFPLRDNDEVLKITSKAFKLLDEGNLAGAILELLSIKGVGISTASKIIGLLDQNRLAIYDSRVGTALRTLKHEGTRIITCPPGRTRPGDFCTYKQWAENYQKLIWVLEVVRDTLDEQGYSYSIADVEMALFMMGK